MLGEPFSMCVRQKERDFLGGHSSGQAGSAALLPSDWLTGDPWPWAACHWSLLPPEDDGCWFLAARWRPRRRAERAWAAPNHPLLPSDPIPACRVEEAEPEGVLCTIRRQTAAVPLGRSLLHHNWSPARLVYIHERRLSLGWSRDLWRRWVEMVANCRAAAACRAAGFLRRSGETTDQLV